MEASNFSEVNTLFSETEMVFIQRFWMMNFTPLKLVKASVLLALVFPSALHAQVVGPTGTSTTGSNAYSIITGVPFLNIAPDSRSGAMGDAGVALSPDANANFWNPSKLAFVDEGHNISASYSPWLRRLVPDVSLSYLAYAHKLDDRNSIGASMRYFNLGSIQLVDNNQFDQGTYRPNEFSLDVSFARKFGESFSLGLTARYIHSNLANGAFVAGQQTRPGNAFAADASAYYRRPSRQFGKDALFTFGVNISNIGTKIGYTDADAGGVKYFLPTNFKIGAANTVFVDDYNEFTLALDLNKLLVPAPVRDANGRITDDRQSMSVPAGIFQSFGNGFNSITFSPALEYRYNRQFALRTGYYYSNPQVDDRQYFTLGAGFKYDIFNLDFSYLIANQQKSPLANTLRFTLMANFGAAKKK